MKGNRDNTGFFHGEFKVYTWENLWAYKFWINVDRKTNNIVIYEAETMKVVQILLFDYFDIADIKWNQEQPSFVVFGNHGEYCVFERI